ncbi:hypothetical protein [Micromonospora sp. NPDC002575]|uniref:hypothetical protein n=1 Tax=Micromonospora sp. NPDC002575 TaxID=3364222 RepID=UPI0036BDBCA6
MTGRIMRIEVRRSAVPGIALLLLIAGAALMLTITGGYSGRWTQLAAYARSTLMLLMPLALAGGAWLGRRDRRHRVDELFGTTVRPRWQRSVPLAAGYAVVLTTVYLLTFLLGAPWVASTAGYFPASTIPITAVGALALVAAGWLGMAAGRAVPRVGTAPVLAVVAFAVLTFVPDYVSMSGYDENFTKVRPDPAALLLAPAVDSLDDFRTIPSSVSLLQALWLAALAATGLLLLGAVGRRAAALAVLPAVVGAAVTVPLLPTGGYSGSAVLDPAAVELVCDDDGPQVCVTRAHAALLPKVVGPARETLALIAAKLPDAAPTRVEESRQVVAGSTGSEPNQVRDDGTLVFDALSVGWTGFADVSADELTSSLLDAAWSQECGDHYATFLPRAVVIAWLTDSPPDLGREPTPEERQKVDAALRSLRNLPAGEQRQRVGAARAAVLGCELDRFNSLLFLVRP